MKRTKDVRRRECERVKDEQALVGGMIPNHFDQATTNQGFVRKYGTYERLSNDSAPDLLLRSLSALQQAANLNAGSLLST